MSVAAYWHESERMRRPESAHIVSICSGLNWEDPFQGLGAALIWFALLEKDERFLLSDFAAIIMQGIGIDSGAVQRAVRHGTIWQGDIQSLLRAKTFQDDSRRD